MAKVPARITTPVVFTDGVRPVVPPENDNTPVLLILTSPVALDTEIPDPAMFDSTPVLANVIVPEPLVAEMPTPVPSVFRVYPVPLPISS
jgi:hypothetical protein